MSSIPDSSIPFHVLQREIAQDWLVLTGEIMGESCGTWQTTAHRLVANLKRLSDGLQEQVAGCLNISGDDSPIASLGIILDEIDNLRGSA